MVLSNASWAKVIRKVMVAGSLALALALPGFSSIESAWGTTLQFEDQRIQVTNELAEFPLAIDGGVALVGAHMVKGLEKDAIYVFRRDNGQWVQKQTLEPWDEKVSHYFKHFSAGLMYRSLAIDGDIAMVPGYSEEEKNRGEVYVFRWNGHAWIKDQKLNFNDDSQIFDGPMAVRGDLAVLGGWKEQDQESIRAVYVFRKVYGIWIKEQMLLPSAPNPRDFFGHEVAISDDRDMIVVGSGFYGAMATIDPVVYVFRREGGTWIETQRLAASADGKPIGHSVALSGDWLFASNPVGGYDEMAEGSVTVFRWNGSAWAEQQTLLASDSYPFNHFGNIVDVNGGVAVIGADIDPVNGSPAFGFQGQAYLFRLSGGVWREEKKLVTSEAQVEASGVSAFGTTAVIDGDTALVSAITSSEPGDVYSYSLSFGGGCGCSSEAGDDQTMEMIP